MNNFSGTFYTLWNSCAFCENIVHWMSNVATKTLHRVQTWADWIYSSRLSSSVYKWVKVGLCSIRAAAQRWQLCLGLWVYRSAASGYSTKNYFLGQQQKLQATIIAVGEGRRQPTSEISSATQSLALTYEKIGWWLAVSEWETGKAGQTLWVNGRWGHDRRLAGCCNGRCLTVM